MTLTDSKADIRRQARERRRETHRKIGRAASLGVIDPGLAGIADRWGGAPPGVVAGYLAVGSELDAGPLMNALAALGWTLALPVVIAPDTPLLFRRWQMGEAMGEGSFGIAEPGEGAAEVRPDVVLAPLLAFDDDGYRLGQGGGFYDRTLAMWRAEAHSITIFGLAFSAQRIDVVPRDQYDQRLDGIVTEQGWRNYGDIIT